MGRRARLSPEKIVDAALALLDREGESGFSMRKLAGEMGVDPMAIYHHHAGRDALMHAVLQAFMRDFEMPGPSGDWRADIRALCQALRRLARRHPGAFRVYELYERWIPAEHGVHEAFHRTLLEAGFPGPTVVRAVRLLLTYTEAFAVDEITGWIEPMDEEERAELAASLTHEDHPGMSGLIDQIATPDTDADFAFGLDVLIRGLEAELD